MPTKKNTKPASGRRSPARPSARGGSAPPGKPGKSIIEQTRGRPWGTIAAAAAVVLFAGAIIAYAVLRKGNNGSSSTPYVNELPAAQAISGVVFHREPNRNHTGGTVHYDVSPPVGGEHNPSPADCTGAVYTSPIPSENAVHSLEHGAVWITYRPGLPAAQIGQLAKLVAGQNYTLMSPYPGLSAPISLQSWGYQLKVNTVSDPRITQFIATLRQNAKTTPEPGASCADPSFTTSHPTAAVAQP